MIDVERDYCDEEMYDAPTCGDHGLVVEMEWCANRCKWVCPSCDGEEVDR